MAKWDSEKLVSSILQSYEDHPESTRLSAEGILNREVLIDVLERIREVLFPGFYEKSRVRKE